MKQNTLTGEQKNNRNQNFPALINRNSFELLSSNHR